MNEEELKLSLLQKGWDEEEIERTLAIMKKGEERQYSRLINQIMYWISLIVAVIGNLMISIMLIPIMMAMAGLWLYFTIAVIAATFGILFNFLIQQIESTQKNKLIVAWLFLPMLAAVNVVFIVLTSNEFSSVLGLLQQNPMAISVVYVVPFTMPYVISAWRKERRRFIVKSRKKEYIPKLYKV